MTIRARAGFTLFQLLVLISLLSLLFALFLPVIAKARAAALRARKQVNLRQMGLACHNYHDANRRFPSGNDGNNFSAAAHLLPYLEQQQLFDKIDFNKSIDDKANAEVRKTSLQIFLSPQDPRPNVTDDYGATNYLFNAGAKFALKDNDGVFFQDSKTRIADIADGTSNTIMIGETLKGDGGTKAMDVRRQYVRLGKDALKDLNDDSGVKDFKDNKNIASDRCASWMDGRFLQGTFTGTRIANDERPDVSCDGLGGLSALRSPDELITVAFCDGSVRTVNAKKINLEVWKALTTRNGGEVIPVDF